MSFRNPYDPFSEDDEEQGYMGGPHLGGAPVAPPAQPLRMPTAPVNEAITSDPLHGNQPIPTRLPASQDTDFYRKPQPSLIQASYQPSSIPPPPAPDTTSPGFRPQQPPGQPLSTTTPQGATTYDNIPQMGALERARLDIGPQRRRGVGRVIGDVFSGLALGGPLGALGYGIAGGNIRYQNKVEGRAAELQQGQELERQQQQDRFNQQRVTNQENLLRQSNDRDWIYKQHEMANKDYDNLFNLYKQQEAQQQQGRPKTMQEAQQRAMSILQAYGQRPGKNPAWDERASRYGRQLNPKDPMFDKVMFGAAQAGGGNEIYIHDRLKTEGILNDLPWEQDPTTNRLAQHLFAGGDEASFIAGLNPPGTNTDGTQPNNAAPPPQRTATDSDRQKYLQVLGVVGNDPNKLAEAQERWRSQFGVEPPIAPTTPPFQPPAPPAPPSPAVGSQAVFPHRQFFGTKAGAFPALRRTEMGAPPPEESMAGRGFRNF